MSCFCCGGAHQDVYVVDKDAKMTRLSENGLTRAPAPTLRSPEMEHPVHLNIYSLLDANDRLRRIGMGVFHAGVVVYGIEWGYGEAVDNPNASGLFNVHPGQAAGTLYRTIKLGVTTKSPMQVDTILHRLEHEWRSSDYHILHRNCNHFAQALCDMLSTVEKLRIPAWCNRAARLGDRVVPRKLATRIQRMLGDELPRAPLRPLQNTNVSEMPTSIIPRDWYLQPTVVQRPRYLIAVEEGTGHTRLSGHTLLSSPILPTPTPGFTMEEVEQLQGYAESIVVKRMDGISTTSGRQSLLPQPTIVVASVTRNEEAPLSQLECLETSEMSSYTSSGTDIRMIRRLPIDQSSSSIPQFSSHEYVPSVEHMGPTKDLSLENSKSVRLVSIEATQSLVDGSFILPSGEPGTVPEEPVPMIPACGVVIMTPPDGAHADMDAFSSTSMLPVATQRGDRREDDPQCSSFNDVEVAFLSDGADEGACDPASPRHLDDASESNEALEFVDESTPMQTQAMAPLAWAAFVEQTEHSGSQNSNKGEAIPVLVSVPRDALRHASPHSDEQSRSEPASQLERDPLVEESVEERLNHPAGQGEREDEHPAAPVQAAVGWPWADACRKPDENEILVAPSFLAKVQAPPFGAMGCIQMVHEMSSRLAPGSCHDRGSTVTSAQNANRTHIVTASMACIPSAGQQLVPAPSVSRTTDDGMGGSISSTTTHPAGQKLLKWLSSPTPASPFLAAQMYEPPLPVRRGGRSRLPVFSPSATDAPHCDSINASSRSLEEPIAIPLSSSPVGAEKSQRDTPAASRSAPYSPSRLESRFASSYLTTIGSRGDAANTAFSSYRPHVLSSYLQWGGDLPPRDGSGERPRTASGVRNFSSNFLLSSTVSASPGCLPRRKSTGDLPIEKTPFT